MNELKGSCTISAQETAHQRCFSVEVKGDTCPADLQLLNMLLQIMGFEVNQHEVPENYTAKVYVKARSRASDIEVFLSHGELSGPRWESITEQKLISVYSDDFYRKGSGGYTDLTKSGELFVTDNVRSAKWIGTVYDHNLSPVGSPGKVIDDQNRLVSSGPVNGQLLLEVESNSAVYDITIHPVDYEVSNRYKSTLIVIVPSCLQEPFMETIDVPACFKGIQGIQTEVPDPPPDFVEPHDKTRSWCLCGNHESTTEPGIFYPGVKRDSKTWENDCVPDGHDGKYC